MEQDRYVSKELQRLQKFSFKPKPKETTKKANPHYWLFKNWKGEETTNKN